jgi:RNA polymerase sigma factor (sigma-70 family)
VTTSKRTLTADRRELAANWHPYALSLVRRLRRRYPEVPADDLVAAAIDGLMIAAAEFDPSRGVPFAGYAALIVWQRGSEAARRWFRRLSTMSLSAFVNNEGESWEPADSSLGDPAQSAADHELVAHICRSLPAREAEALWLLYAEDRTLAEVGQRFGASRQCVARLERRAVLAARRATK